MAEKKPEVINGRTYQERLLKEIRDGKVSTDYANFAGVDPITLEKPVLYNHKL